MNRIAYTSHATHWMRMRHITPHEVKVALADPEIHYPGHGGRTEIRTHLRGRLLRIASDLHRGTCLVLSVVAPEEEPDAA